MKTHLVFAIMTMVLLGFVISQGTHRTVNYDIVVSMASERSHEPYRPPEPIPAVLSGLSYDQVRDIRFREDATLWRPEGLPFQARFFFAAGGGKDHSPTPITV